MRLRRLIVAVPYLWLLLFFLAPFAIVLRMSLSDADTALPPYAPHFEGFATLWEFIGKLDLKNFRLLSDDALYWDSYLQSVRLAGLTTLISLALGYPLAYAMAAAPRHWRPVSARARSAAVLDLVPDPGLRLDRYTAARRPARHGARRPRRNKRAVCGS